MGSTHKFTSAIPCNTPLTVLDYYSNDALHQLQFKGPSHISHIRMPRNSSRTSMLFYNILLQCKVYMYSCTETFIHCQQLQDCDTLPISSNKSCFHRILFLPGVYDLSHWPFHALTDKKLPRNSANTASHKHSFSCTHVWHMHTCKCQQSQSAWYTELKLETIHQSCLQNLRRFIIFNLSFPAAESHMMHLTQLFFAIIQPALLLSTVQVDDELLWRMQAPLYPLLVGVVNALSLNCWLIVLLAKESSSRQSLGQETNTVVLIACKAFRNLISGWNSSLSYTCRLAIKDLQDDSRLCISRQCWVKPVEASLSYFSGNANRWLEKNKRHYELLKLSWLWWCRRKMD